MKRYLFFISLNYSFEILRPLQQKIIENGDSCCWFVYGNKINRSQFSDAEVVLDQVEEVINYHPDAVFVPGNIVPAFIPGLKVQVFHGFEWKKKGHFSIRDCFDLYCTQGPLFTEKFNDLAQQHGYFDVVETGWPKLDPLFSAKPLDRNNSKLPCILYAPTFSPSLFSTPDLAEHIVRLSYEKEWQWLVKFHPKMEADWVEYFRNAAHDKLQIIEQAEIAPVLQAADVILSDTSSIITEFMLLGRPAVTYRNIQPEPALIDFTDPDGLEEAIGNALQLDEKRRELIDSYNQGMHPYQDGKSSKRILDAVFEILQHGRKSSGKMPLNLFRNLKMRRKLGYWKNWL